MHVTRFPTARAFLHVVEPWLLEREAENGLLLGIAATVASEPDRGASAYFAAVLDQGRPVLAAFSTHPEKLGVSASHQPGAIPLLASDVAGACPAITSIGGPEPTSEQLAREVARIRGATSRRSKAMRIFELREVRLPAVPPPGRLRLAEMADWPVVVPWIRQFLDEIGEPGDGGERATRLIGEQQLFLWDDQGPVSMAAATRKTRHGIAVNLVYTPVERRNHGYASACVAGVSARLLSQGNQFCCLYTDLANPTSNAIYSRIGYQPICEAGLYSLERQPE
jgi:predicted GNAT family acetyltransferase